MWLFKHLSLLLVCQLALGFYSKESQIQSLGEDTINQAINSGGLWLIEFYAPWCGHCKNLVPTWEETGKALQGIVNVAAIDADAHKSLAGEFGIQGFPTIKLVYIGKGGKRKAVEYKGGRTARDIVDWSLGQAKKIAAGRLKGGSDSESKGSKKSGAPSGAPSGGFYGPNSHVISLTDSNFHSEIQGEEPWLIEFYAPWCGHCKNLKSDWEQLASETRGKAKVGAVDCTANEATCQEFGVQGYPTLKFFGADKEQPSEYGGARDSSSMAAFLLQEWRKNQPPPEAKELVDQHIFEKDCLGDEEQPPQKLCFLTFLPDILDSKAAGRKAYIETLSKLAEKYSDRPFSYLWTQGGAHAGLEAAVGVGGFGYPALVALNPKDGKYAALRESFSLEHILEFVENLRQGFERVTALNGKLPELETIKAWDGNEGAAIEEDEFSLEDLLKDEL